MRRSVSEACGLSRCCRLASRQHQHSSQLRVSLNIALQRPADVPGKGVELIKSAAKRAHPRASLRMGVGPAVLEIGPLVTCAPQISISEQQLCACPRKFTVPAGTAIHCNNVVQYLNELFSYCLQHKIYVFAL